jgi:D-alanyl-D-alanine carboxypeptidase
MRDQEITYIKSASALTFSLDMRRLLLLAVPCLLMCACSQSQSPATTTIAAAPEIKSDHAIKTTGIDSTSVDTALRYSKEELLGRFDPARHPDFVKIEAEHTDKPNIYMRAQAYNAYLKMASAAKKEGVDIRIISATRNFDYQKGIWEKKWKREQYTGRTDLEKVKDILKYSSMPGTSRHHWGTDVDFNSVELSYFASGPGKKLYEWLVKNGATYGFAQTYTSKADGRTGFEEEKWHWS